MHYEFPCGINNNSRANLKTDTWCLHLIHYTRESDRETALGLYERSANDVAVGIALIKES
jgi:hypothetical protein